MFQQLKKNPRTFIALQLSFLYMWIVNLQHTNAYLSVYLLIAVLACAAMFSNSASPDTDSGKTKTRIAIFAAIFSGAIVLANYTLFEPWTALLSLFNAGCTFLGGWFAFRHILSFAVRRYPMPVRSEDRLHPGIIYWGAFAITAAWYLCGLIFHSYPGLLGTDSFTTIRQILSGEYDNTMPFWHTLTVQLFFQPVYLLTGNINTAAAFFSVFQILFLAASFSYAVMTLYQIGVPRILVGLIFMGYTFLPYNVAYSVTLWKDVLFGGAALLVVTSLYRILRSAGKKGTNELVFILGSAGLCLWRTNGWYAMAVSFVIMLFALGKSYRRILIMLGVVLLICWILINPFLTWMNVPETDFVEALAVPFQQVARVVATDCPLTEEETEMLEEIFYLDLVKRNYDPKTVDPIKFYSFRIHNKNLLKENMLDYLGLWVKLGARYPGVYLQAWIEETKGYWNAGYENWIYMYHMDENDMGFAHTRGKNPISSLFWAMSRYLERPEILRPVYSIGLHIWMTATACFVCKIQKRKEWIITVPILVLVAGLIVGTPVFAEFRYAYPVFTAIPVIGCVMAYDKEERK